MIDLVEASPRERIALLEPEHRRSVTYGELIGLVDDAATRLVALMGGRGLVFLALGSDVDGVVLYLACLRARLPVCLLDAAADPLARVAAVYAPSLLALPDGLAAPSGYTACRDTEVSATYTLWLRDADDAPADLHQDLAVLLTTSGTTGNPKLVRITPSNLASNAMAIREYLGLTPGERAVQSLPMHYSYGLSVLNSHLAAGASIALTPHSFMRPEFWSVVDEHTCTSFAGVPYMYQTLQRLRFSPGRHGSLRTFTQAGGALRHDLVEHFREATAATGARFFVMYGQTEATARISFVPPQRLVEKVGSIGVPIPGGALSLSPVDDADGLEEIVYRGPNVMMGYAERADDLRLGDLQQGVWRPAILGGWMPKASFRSSVASSDSRSCSAAG